MFDENFIQNTQKRYPKMHNIHHEVVQLISSNIQDIENISRDKILNITHFNNRTCQDLSGNYKEISPNEIQNLDEKFNIVISANNMHKINNIEQYMLKINDILEKNGFFFGTILGEGNCIELASSFYEAYMAKNKGFINHFLPIVRIQDAGFLLKKFKNIVISKEDKIVKYSDIYKALKDIKSMGESNCMINRLQKPISREILSYANDIFINKYQGKTTYSILTLFGQKVLPE